MIRLKISHFPVAVLLAAAVILSAGGFAVASNMGFKLNKVLITRSGTGNIGKNYVSFPDNNPYVNSQGICAQLGLPGPVLGSTLVEARNIGPVGLNSGPARGFVTYPCNSTSVTPFNLQPGSMYSIRPASSFPTGTGVIIVGSHDPTLVQNIWKTQSVCLNSTGNATFTPCTSNSQCPGSACGTIGQTWLAVPYHTTAVNAYDLCKQFGLKQVFPGGKINDLDSQTGNFTTADCSNSAAASLVNLVLGKGIEITDTNGTPGTPVAETVIPAHF